MSDKRLVFRIYKTFSKLNSNVTSKPVRKWAKEINRYFTKEDIEMANKHIKRFSVSLATQKMHIETTMRCYYILSYTKIFLNAN